MTEFERDQARRTEADRRFGISLAVILFAILTYATLVHTAPAIEADIERRAAEATLSSTSRETSVVVDGRHVTVSGYVATEAERDRVLAAADQTWGALGPADLLLQVPEAAPYRLSAVRGPDGTVTIEGVAPSPEARSAIVAEARERFDDPAVDVQLALGAPDLDWAGAASVGFEALSRLADGEAVIEDDMIALVGRTPASPEPISFAPSRGAAEELGLRWDAEIAFRAPRVDVYRLDLTKSDDGVWSIDGHVPTPDERARLTDVLKEVAGDDADVSLRLAEGAATPDWTDGVEAGVYALSIADAGTIAFEDGSAQIDAEVATIAALNEVLALTTGSGGLEWVRSVAYTDVVAPAPTVDAAPTEAQAPAASDVSEPTPDEEASAAPHAEPGQLVVTIGAQDGLAFDGAPPDAMSLDEARALLGLVAETPEVAADDADLNAWRADLAALGEFLPEFDTLRATFGDGGVSVDGRVHAASDVEQVTAQLTAALGALGPPALSIAATDAAFDDGAERVDPLTGRREVWRAGYWLPQVDVADAAEACPRETAALAAEDRVRFVSESSDLDVRARAALNALAALATACVDAGSMMLEVGGHTDNAGDADYNLSLSERRAQVVVDALVDRGVPADRMIVRGYGETQPIAENDTPEGRAANRRITFDWSAP